MIRSLLTLGLALLLSPALGGCVGSFHQGPMPGEPKGATFATVDVSFIGLRLIFPPLAAALPAGATAVVLVKPQFELGPEAVGKGGIVRDPAQRAPSRPARRRVTADQPACRHHRGRHLGHSSYLPEGVRIHPRG